MDLKTYNQLLYLLVFIQKREKKLNDNVLYA